MSSTRKFILSVERPASIVNRYNRGFPPCHELVAAQGWDPVRVAAGLRNETVNLANAGYNVHGRVTLTPGDSRDVKTDNYMKRCLPVSKCLLVCLKKECTKMG
jgi:hypothetical protein